jgi:hypothetical protein
MRGVPGYASGPGLGQARQLFWSASGTGTSHYATPGDFIGGQNPSAYLNFAAGQSQATISVQVAGDADVEPDERFSVNLSDSTGQIFARATGVIQNDDTAPPGQVLTSHQSGDTLTGGPGNDTLNAGRGPDVLTGANGADAFVWNDLPWNPGRVTDFTPGVDVLDLRRIFAAAGYSGSDPVADGYLKFDVGGGGAIVKFDADGNGGSVVYPTTITTLEHVSISDLSSSDWLFR